MDYVGMYQAVLAMQTVHRNWLSILNSNTIVHFLTLLQTKKGGCIKMIRLCADTNKTNG